MSQLKKIANTTNNPIVCNGIYIGPKAEIVLTNDVVDTIDKQYFLTGILVVLGDFEDNNIQLEQNTQPVKNIEQPSRRRRPNPIQEKETIEEIETPTSAEISDNIEEIEDNISNVTATTSTTSSDYVTLEQLSSTLSSSISNALVSYYQKPPTGIPYSDLDESTQQSVERAKRAVLSGQIELTDLAPDLQTQIQKLISTSLGSAGTADIIGPNTYIPITKNSLSQDILNDLTLAETAYQKPTTGIPLSDLDDETQSLIIEERESEHWLSPVDSVLMLPLSNNTNGDVRIVLADNSLWRWDDAAYSWTQIEGLSSTSSGYESSTPIPVQDPNVVTSVISEFFASGGQVKVVLPTEYPFGTNQLMVWVNGLLVQSGTNYDYVEIDNRTIQFNQPLQADDYVVCGLSGASTGYILTQVVDVTARIRQITLQYAYTMNTNALRVFLNGIQLTGGPNEDYVEIDSKTVGFNIDLLPGDTVAIRIENNTMSQNVFNQIAMMKEIYINLANKVSELQKQLH